jgi:hypothetical protein
MPSGRDPCMSGVNLPRWLYPVWLYPVWLYPVYTSHVSCWLPQPRPLPPSALAGGLKGNWEAFWAAALRDHCHAGLIWNESTRAELALALSAEEQVGAGAGWRG